MSGKGRVSRVLTPEEMEHLKRLIEDIRSHLSSFAVQLTPEERRRGLRAGERTLPFVAKVVELLPQVQDFLPPFISVEELRKDYELWRQMSELRRLLSSVLELVEDTEMVAGSEAYQASLLVYGALQQASKAGVAGVDTFLEELKTRFPQRTRRSSEEEGNEGSGDESE